MSDANLPSDYPFEREALTTEQFIAVRRRIAAIRAERDAANDKLKELMRGLRDNNTEFELAFLDAYLDKFKTLTAERDTLAADRDAWKAVAQIQSHPSPCGHPGQYAYTSDSGAHIECLVCSRDALAARVQELREAAEKGLLALAALVISGECTASESALCDYIKDQIIEGHDALFVALTKLREGSEPMEKGRPKC